MTIAHEAIAALPVGADANAALIRAMATRRVAYALADSEDVTTFVAVDPDAGTVPLYLVQNGSLFKYDSTDTTTVHDGVTCLVTSDGKRYKTAVVDYPWSVLDKDLVAQPASPSVGDRYRVPNAATGTDWAGKDGKVAIYTAAGWQFATVPTGRLLYVQDEAAFYHRNAAGTWTAGVGSLVYGADTISLSNVIGADASYVIKVENQTTNYPPGSRVTGATPTVPLGGTAANINDNNTATTSTTSALGNLTGLPVASRIIAQLDLGSSRSLVGTEVKQFSCSASSGTCGLYYSVDGTTWTQHGSLFTVTTTPTDNLRASSITARYVALVTTAQNWTTNTNTLGDLNAYSTDIVASVGAAYIIGTNPVGTWKTNSGKLAICEVANTFTIYTPAEGDSVWDKALNALYTYNGSAWVSGAGAWAKLTGPVKTLSGSSTAAGTNLYTYSTTVAPTTANECVTDTASISHTAAATGAKLRLCYSATLSYTNVTDVAHTGTSPYLVAAVLRDAETTAIAWRRLPTGVDGDLVCVDLTFHFTALDTSSHAYKVALFSAHVSTDVSIKATPFERAVTIEEAA